VLFAALASSGCARPAGPPRCPDAERIPPVKTTTQASGQTPREDGLACKRALADEPFATPEAAVKLYIESVAASDFACASRAYAAHELARVDFTALVGWVGVFNAGVQNAPAEYPMFAEINELRAKAEMAQATKFFVYRLLTDKDPGGSQAVTSEAEIRAFVGAVNPAQLAMLRVVRIDQPRKSLSDDTQVLFKKVAARYGADEITERVALYKLSDQFFWSGFQLARYNKAWKIFQFASFYAGPPGGDKATTTVAEYEARIQ
jgi:hypothetical protein